MAQREDNRRQIAAFLRVRGPLTQANLARLSGLSPSTVSTIVAELQASGTVKAVEDPNPRKSKKVGRPGSLIALDPSVGAFVGIDIEHERFMVLVADAAHTVLAEERRPLQRDHDAGTVMRLVADLVDDLTTKAGVDRDRLSGAGVGLAGPINLATGQIHPSSVAMSWRFVDVRTDLGALLDLPVFLDNDANLGALAEMTWGAGRGVTEAAYIKADIGVGAALVLGGHIHRGAAGIAGEIGHSTIDENGPVCRCGNRGCLEGFVGENALLDSLRPRYRPDLTFEEVVAMAHDGDVVCRRVIADAGRLLGMQVAGLCNLLNPSRVIVGGSLATAGEILLEPIRLSIAQRALPEAAGSVEVVLAELGDRAISLGAVALAMRQAGTPGNRSSPERRLIRNSEAN
jgi:predicted NBD/HSP70 family sugar kinase